MALLAHWEAMSPNASICKQCYALYIFQYVSIDGYVGIRKYLVYGKNTLESNYIARNYNTNEGGKAHQFITCSFCDCCLLFSSSITAASL